MYASGKSVLFWTLSVTLPLIHGAAVHPRHHPRGPICYEDNQLRALERFSDEAKGFCPSYLQQKAGKKPQWAAEWSAKEIHSACSCFEKTFSATALTSPTSIPASAGTVHNSGSVSTSMLPEPTPLPQSASAASSAVLGSASAPMSALPTSSTSSVSSNTPSSSTISKSAGSGSGKRGLCYDYKTKAGWSKYFAESKYVTFGSNWGEDRAIGGVDLLSPDASFAYVPTIKVDSNLNNDNWLSTIPNLIKSGTTTLFASNEPDNAGQANLTPSQAASVYKKYMQPFKGQAALGTPAVTNGGSPGGLTFLEAFLDKCTGCTFDFINIHYYLQRSDVNTKQFTQAFKDYIDKDIPAMQAKYKQLKGLKIMIGEWWLWDASESEGGELMDDLLPYLDNNDSVMGYQAFGGLWAGNFITSDGSGLTPAGQKYNASP